MKHLKLNSTIHLFTRILFSFILIIVFWSCERDEEQITEELSVEQQEKVSKEIIDLLKKNGFDTHDIISYENGYIVEGDIFISHENIEEFKKGSNENSSKHFVRTSLVSNNRSIRTLRVYIASNFSSSNKNAIKAALNRYNVLNLTLRFSETTNINNADIVFRIRTLTGSVANANAVGSWPSNGNPGSTITYNSRRLGAVGNNVTLAAHELGHTIGFRHTDAEDRSFSCGGPRVNEGGTVLIVPGTPRAPVANSWMLSCRPDGVERPFLLVDKIALYNVYGIYSGVRGAPLWLRNRSKVGSGYFYTYDYREIGEGTNDFRVEGIQSRIFDNSRKNDSDKQPLYRYNNPSVRDYFYTTDFNELNGATGGQGYTYEGIAGYIYKNNAAGRVPVLRYNKNGIHFYTTDPNELGQGGFGFVLEGTIGYTLPHR